MGPRSKVQVAVESAIARSSILGLSVILVLASAIMSVTFLMTPVSEDLHGLMQVVETAGALERVALWQRSTLELFGFADSTQFPVVSRVAEAWIVRAAYLGMFAAQFLAFALVLSTKATKLSRWLIGPIIAHIAMLAMPPSNADVFFYAMTGDLARTNNNPYAHRLAEFPTNPFLPYNHWVDMSAVYGPLWTRINEMIVWATGPSPALAAFVYKCLLGMTAIGLAILVWWFVRRLTDNATLAVAAGVLVAWQPNLIVETSGLAHNDPVMLLFSTAGIVLAIMGGTSAVRGGVILITASALVKFVSAPLLGLLGLTRLADRRRMHSGWRLLGAWSLDGIAIASVLVAAFLPFWVGFKTVSEMISEPGRLFSSPIYLYPKVGLEHMVSISFANTFEKLVSPAVQVSVIFIVLATIVWFGRTVWQLPDSTELDTLPGWTGPLIASWTIIMTTLALLPVNAHPWYWTWPVVPIAINCCYLSARRTDNVALITTMPRWLWAYLILTCAMTIAYHTRIVHP